VGTNEGEANCTTDYVDSTNAGCSAFVPVNQKFLAITCGQTYCGKSGTYRTNFPCLTQDDCSGADSCEPAPGPGVCVDDTNNTRDEDWYRVVVTAPSRLSWSISADFPVALQIISSPNATSTLLGHLSDTNSCQGLVAVASTTNLEVCTTTLAEADVCPGVYYLSVTVSTASATIRCDSQNTYTATLSCTAASVSAGGCCKGDMNNDGRKDGKDIQLWIDELRRPIGSVDKTSGCFNLKTCRADYSGNYAVRLSEDLSGFVTDLLAAVKPTCPPALCGEASSCHLPSADGTGVISDMSDILGGRYRVADDFKVSSATGTSPQITKVCWWGFYFDFVNFTPCTPIGGDVADSFLITFYNDNAGLPGTKLAGPISVSPTKTTPGNVDLNYLGRKVRRHYYEATLPSPVALSPNGCYWLEIVNHNSTSGNCLWLWETSKNGNTVTAQRHGGPAGKENWSSIDLISSLDQAWCLEGGPAPTNAVLVSSVDCGLPLGRCCVYPGQICSVTDRQNCENVLGGIWVINGNCSNGCPVKPANDDCANATIVTANALYTGSTLFATRGPDSVPMNCEGGCEPQCNTANDVWYRWVNNDPAFGGPISNPVFSMCTINDPSVVYDAMMVVYNACPTVGGTQVLGGCNDDGCANIAAFGTVSRVALANQPTGLPPSCEPIDTNSDPSDDCYLEYWIRISGWLGRNGNHTFKVFRP